MLRSHRFANTRPRLCPRRTTLLAGGAFLTLAPSLALAAGVTSTWQGGSSGDWSVAANWSPSSAYPDSGNAGNTYSAVVSFAAVTLTEDITLDALSLDSATLSGAYTLVSGDLGLTLAGNNTLSNGLALQAAGSFVFAPGGSLTNHGTFQFGVGGYSANTYYASSATFTNASDGTLRFNPSSGTSVGDFSTSPFNLTNQGTVLADNGSSNYLYVPVSQSSSGLLRSTSGSTLYLYSGGTLAGTLQADSASYLSLTGSGQTYTLDQTAITGAGEVRASYANLTGSLASGSLVLESATLTGAFVNQPAATLLWRSYNTFAPGASLINHGTVQFGINGFVSSAYYPSTSTFTTASDGTLRFHPSSGTSVGDFSTSPFNLTNQGTVLADNGSSNYLYVPVSQSSSGLLRSTSGSTLYLNSGGTLAGTLQADAASYLSLTGSGQTYTLDQTAITGAGEVRASYANVTGSLASGSLVLESATLTGAFVNQSAATLLWRSYNAFAPGSSLTNHGTVQFGINGFVSNAYYPSTSTFTNASDGTLRFHPSSGTSVGDFSTSPFNLVNQGTVLADNGSSNYLYVPVSQSSSGLLRSTSGSTLYLNSGGTLAGTLQADAASYLSLTGSSQTYTLDQTAITGAGEVRASYANVTGSLASGSLVLESATLTGAFVNQSAATLLWRSYNAFAPGSSLTNHGTVQFGVNGFVSNAYYPSSSTLTNASDGTVRFHPSSGTSVGDFSTSPFNLVNQGTVLADNGSSNYLYVPVSQSSSGLLRATSGSSLYLYAGGTLAGTLQADAASYLSLTGSSQTYTLDQTAITGAGEVRASYANVTGSLASGSLVLESATLTGAFVNQSAATLLWRSYNVFAPGSSLTNHGTVQFGINGFVSNAYSPSSSTLTNASDGTLRFHPSSGTAVGDSSTSPFNLVNQGTVLADNGSSNYLYTPVANTGLVRIQSGSSLSFQNGFVQTAGEVRVENAGLSAGFGQTLDFQGGLLRASGYISAGLSLADTALEVGSAQTAASLSIYGDVTLLSGASATFDLDGLAQGTGYDSISVNGAVTLGGGLAIRLSSAFASTIASTDEFILLTASSIGGTFANVQSGDRISLPGGAGSFLVTVTGTELKIGDFAAIPEPAVGALLSGLGAALAFAGRRRARRA